MTQRINMRDFTVTRYAADGFELSTIFNGYREHRRYIGYTLREARQDFAEYLRGLK